MKDTFEAIGQNEKVQHRFSKEFPELLVTKYKFHFIFYLCDDSEKPVIIGIIHEKRDIVSRLSERLT